MEISDMRRKAVRIALADRLCEIAKRHGATIERNEHPRIMPRAILIWFRTPAADCHVTLNGEWRGSAWLAHWVGNDVTLRPSFSVAVGDLHGTHPSKATTCSYDFDEFAERFEAGLALLASMKPAPIGAVS